MVQDVSARTAGKAMSGVGVPAKLPPACVAPGRMPPLRQGRQHGGHRAFQFTAGGQTHGVRALSRRYPARRDPPAQALCAEGPAQRSGRLAQRVHLPGQRRPPDRHHPDAQGPGRRFRQPEGRGDQPDRPVPRLGPAQGPAAAAFGREASVAGRRLLRGLRLPGQAHQPHHRHRAPGPPVGQPAAALQRRPGGRPAGGGAYRDGLQGDHRGQALGPDPQERGVRSSAAACANRATSRNCARTARSP